MSGAEPIAVLGVISSVIAIVEAVKKIYESAKDSQGFDKTFRSVSECIPVILSILHDAKTAQAIAVHNLGQTNDTGQEQSIVDDSTEVAPIMRACKANVEVLKDILQRAATDQGASRLHRYTKAIRVAVPGREQRVEQLLKNTIERLQLLQCYHYFKAMPSLAQIPCTLEEVDAASSSANELEPSDTAQEARDDITQESAKSSLTHHHNYWSNSDGTKVMFQGGVQHNTGVQNFTF